MKITVCCRKKWGGVPQKVLACKDGNLIDKVDLYYFLYYYDNAIFFNIHVQTYQDEFQRRIQEFLKGGLPFNFRFQSGRGIHPQMLSIGLSDHHLVYSVRNNFRGDPQLTHVHVKYRNKKSCLKAILLTIIIYAVAWNLLPDIDSMWSSFRSKFMTVVDKPI